MALDNFIPKNAVKLCNKCRLRKNYTATCDVYPSGIPKKVLLSSDCPDFDPKERDGTQENRTAPIIEDGKTLDELVAGDKYEESIVAEARRRGGTDEEIWEFLNEL
mgnify:CR=1 FL=1